MEKPTTIKQIEFGLRAIMDNPDFAMSVKKIGNGGKGIVISSVEADKNLAKVSGDKAFDYYEEIQAIQHQSVGEFDHIIYDGKTPTAEQREEEHKKINDDNPYDMGIHKKIKTFLDRQGWIAEWQECEAVMIVQDD